MSVARVQSPDYYRKHANNLHRRLAMQVDALESKLVRQQLFPNSSDADMEVTTQIGHIEGSFRDLFQVSTRMVKDSMAILNSGAPQYKQFVATRDRWQRAKTARAAADRQAVDRQQHFEDVEWDWNADQSFFWSSALAAIWLGWHMFRSHG